VERNDRAQPDDVTSYGDDYEVIVSLGIATSNSLASERLRAVASTGKFRSYEKRGARALSLRRVSEDGAVKPN
jgi:hypothetical protein